LKVAWPCFLFEAATKLLTISSAEDADCLAAEPANRFHKVHNWWLPCGSTFSPGREPANRRGFDRRLSLASTVSLICPSYGFEGRPYRSFVLSKKKDYYLLQMIVHLSVRFIEHVSISQTFSGAPRLLC
jgi:hypothetical protein